MPYLLSGFRRFVEEMDSSAEKRADSGDAPSDPVGNDYIDTLEDEFGIRWKDLSKILQSEPYVSSHFMLGKPDSEMTYKMSAWEIVPGTLTPKGAYIRIKPSRGMRYFSKDGKLGRFAPDADQYYVTRDELVKFLTTAWVPSAPGGDAGMGMM